MFHAVLVIHLAQVEGFQQIVRIQSLPPRVLGVKQLEGFLLPMNANNDEFKAPGKSVLKVRLEVLRQHPYALMQGQIIVVQIFLRLLI